MSGSPRRHHYAFAHVELRQAALRFGADLVAMARDNRLALDSVWDRLGASLHVEDRLPSAGLSASLHEVAGNDVLVATLPPPQNPTECHFAAIIVPKDGGPVRYMTLERAESVLSPGVYTMLCGWTQDGSHVNYGAGPEPTLDAFLAALAS